MKTGFLWLMILILTIVIIILAYVLFLTPAHAPTIETQTPTSTTTTTQATSTTTGPAPLHTRVVIKSPAAGAKVGSTFDVKGEAPGGWYFEATFPIQVRDKDDNVIARAHANALSDWMTDKQVPFATTVTLDTNYKGAATLIILKDNPSGLPENDDSVEVPITIQ